MSSNQITTMSEPEDANIYLTELEQVLRRMIGKRANLRLHQAEDFIQYFLMWAWGRPDLMERYVPRALASACFNQRLIDFLRREGRQLPQGEYDNKSGKVRNAVWSLDHVLHQDGDDVFTFGDMLEGNDDWMDRLLSNDLVERALSVLTPQQRAIFLLVEGMQYKVVEVAEMFGYRREWAQRELGKARWTLTQFAQS